MNKLILLAGATMLVTVAPAAAKPGNGQGHGKSAHSAMAHGNSGRARTVHGRGDVGLIRASNGRLYALDRRGSCPPGLAKKGNGCMPPGQAKKLYNVGQRYNRNFGNLWSYNQIPDYLQDRYRLDQSDRYYYRDGYLYQVDPRTMLVQQVISALLR
jgi:hypothetical protein